MCSASTHVRFTPNSDRESRHQREAFAIALTTASAKSANFRDRAPCMKSSRRALVISSWTPAPRRPLLQILLLLGRVTAAGGDLAVEPRGTELCVDQVPQLIIAPAHIDGLIATGKSMYSDDEIAHRDQSEAFGLVELRGRYVKLGVGPRPQSLEII